MFKLPKVQVVKPLDVLTNVLDSNPLTDVQIGIPAAVIVPVPPQKPTVPANNK